MAGRECRHSRLAGEGVFANAQMPPRLIRRSCVPDAECERPPESAMTRPGLSARAYDRILKVSRIIADPDGSEAVRPAHAAEAAGHRPLDRTCRV